MRAGLLLVSLSLVALAQANYDLKCAKSELSIRWPSYESNSEYYVCSRLFGRRMTVHCNPGEVFTFVLQSCTSPSRYIPAPAVANLPTAAPLPSQPNEDGLLTPLVIPPELPPVLSPPSDNMPLPQPPVGPPTIAPGAVLEVNNQPENSLVDIAETDGVTPPLPPTPAPTPPFVEKVPGKKPGGKKPTKNKKTTTSNKKPTVAGKQTNKKPNAASGKKTTTAHKKGKQNSKADKTPKKAMKKPNAKDKKTKKEN